MHWWLDAFWLVWIDVLRMGVPLKSSGWSSISWLKLTFWDIKHPGMAHCWSEKAIMLHFRTRVGVGQVPKKIEAPTTIGPLKVLRGYPRPRRDGLMEGLSFAGRGPKGWVPDVLGIVQTILPTWDIAMICLTERERGREGERERGREGERERGREGERRWILCWWLSDASQLRSFTSVVSVLTFEKPIRLHWNTNMGKLLHHISPKWLYCSLSNGAKMHGFLLSSPFYLFQTARKYPIFQIDPNVISLPRYIPFYPVISPSPILSPRQQECQGCEATNGKPERGGVFDGIFGPRMAFFFL